MSDPQEAATPSDPHSAEALDLDAIEKRAASFIAHASTDVPALIAAVRSRDAEVAELHRRVRNLLGEQVAGIGFMNQRDELAAEVAELKAKIAEIRAIHRPKMGSSPRYADDDFEHEREPVAWEDYMICDYDKTPWPCKSAQILGSASSPVEGGN